jgi:methionine synthase II (cobalamin-independent)
MTKATQPFRAEQVGSLLRTRAITEARAKVEKGEMTPAELKGVEDREIKALITKQEDVGLQPITDGEFRRAWWHYDFFGALQGVKLKASDKGIQFNGIQTKALVPSVAGKIGFGDHPMIEHFKFVAANTKRTPKMTIPSPSMLYYRGSRAMFEPGTYDNIDRYYADMAQTFADCFSAFYKAGCRYLQLDDVSYAYLCDPNQRAMLKTRGDDPDDLGDRNAKMINGAAKGRPNDLLLTMHLCRGNFRSTFVASGGYEPIADLLFNQVDVDGYFLEYDNERAGGFEPLRYLPKHKFAVLGLVTTKTGEMESAGDIKRRIDEATKYAPLENLCLSPQCGFASTEEGNTIAEDEQWKKLEMVVKIAEEVWG